jgi:hypothetical protein
MDNVEVITKVTFIFFIFLILALFVERLIEVLMAIFNYIELRFKFYRFWNRQAERYQLRFERLYGFQGEDGGQKKKILDWVIWKTIIEPSYAGGKYIVSSNLIRLNYMRVATRGLAFGLALILVISQGLNLVEVIEQLIPMAKKVSVVTQTGFVRLFLTAFAISIGSEPLHHIIGRIEKVGKKKSDSSKGGQS